MRFGVAMVLLAACSPPDARGAGRHDRHPSESTDSGGTPPTVSPSTATDTAPTDTGTAGPLVDCGDLPLPPFTGYTLAIETEEDFDFDAFGFLIYQSGVDLVGQSLTPEFKVIAPNASTDAAGVQVLSTGDIAVASPDSASLRLFDPDGGYTTLVSNVTQLNGLEIGPGDRIYYSEMTTDGRVGWVDPYTGEQGVVLDHVYSPNGLALSPDATTLYIAGGTSADDSYVFAVDLVGVDVWSEPRVVLEATDDTFDSIEVDACGAVYTAGFSHGNILRTFPDAGISESLAKLEGDGWGSFSSMRFGNGLGGFERDTLYVTDRQQIYAVDIDALGRPHPSNPLP